MVTVRDRDPDRQTAAPQVRDGRSQRRIEGAARHQPIASVDEMAQAGSPPARIDTVADRDRIAVVRAHVVEIALLAGARMIGRMVGDVAHDLGVGSRAPEPGLLGRERAGSVQVDAAGPARENGRGRVGSGGGGTQRRDGHRHGEDESGERPGASEAGHRHIVARIGDSRRRWTRSRGFT
jgi:hypothetical protein